MNAEQASEGRRLAFETLVYRQGKVKVSRAKLDAAKAELEAGWEVAYDAWRNLGWYLHENP
jgi:hypothetical protein